jgi:hypothetical protein
MWVGISGLLRDHHHKHEAIENARSCFDAQRLL